MVRTTDDLARTRKVMDEGKAKTNEKAVSENFVLRKEKIGEEEEEGNPAASNKD